MRSLNTTPHNQLVGNTHHLECLNHAHILRNSSAVPSDYGAVHGPYFDPIWRAALSLNQCVGIQCCQRTKLLATTSGE